MPFTGNRDQMRLGAQLTLAGLGLLVLALLLHIPAVPDGLQRILAPLGYVVHPAHLLLIGGSALCWVATREYWPRIWFAVACACAAAGWLLLLVMLLLRAPMGPLAVPALDVTATGLFLCALMNWQGETTGYVGTISGGRRRYSPYALPSLLILFLGIVPAVGGLIRPSAGIGLYSYRWVFLIPLIIFGIGMLLRLPRAQEKH